MLQECGENMVTPRHDPHHWWATSPYVTINIHASLHVIPPWMVADVMEPILAQQG